VIPSSYSSSSSGCSSCFAALSGSAAISGMSMGSDSGSGHVGQTLVPLDVAEVWALSDRPVCRTTFNPFLSQNVSDEKRKRQTPGLHVLNPPMVHSFTKFLNLAPFDLGLCCTNLIVLHESIVTNRYVLHKFNCTHQLHESIVIEWMCKCECRTHRESVLFKN
jgi:hypothetical protein